MKAAEMQLDCPPFYGDYDGLGIDSVTTARAMWHVQALLSWPFGRGLLEFSPGYYA